jgi:hypothetical protein
MASTAWAAKFVLAAAFVQAIRKTSVYGPRYIMA